MQVLVDQSQIFYSVLVAGLRHSKTVSDGVPSGAIMASAEFDDTIEEKDQTFKSVIRLQKTPDALV